MSTAHVISLRSVRQEYSFKKIFFIVLAVLLVMATLYIYLVNRMVVNIVGRQQAEHNISTLNGTIGALESKYIALKNGVTLDVAYAQGFHDATPVSYLSTNQNSALTYNYSR